MSEEVEIDVDLHGSRDCFPFVHARLAFEILFDKPAGFVVKSIANLVGDFHNRHGAIAIDNGVQSDRSLNPSLPGIVRVIGFHSGFRARRCRRTAHASNPIDSAASSAAFSGADARPFATSHTMSTARADSTSCTCAI